jgi:hypothetical protein
MKSQFAPHTPTGPKPQIFGTPSGMMHVRPIGQSALLEQPPDTSGQPLDAEHEHVSSVVG